MSIDDLAKLIRTPGIEFRPEARWWLAEGLHTDETLRFEIDAAHRLGFGGMEFLAMDEQNVDHARYGWGSEEWVHDSQIVVEETTKRGMSVSFTSGTNWSNANLPSIDADHPAAAMELDVTIERLSGGESRTGALTAIDLAAAPKEGIFPGHRGTITKQSLAAVVAARVVDASGSVPVLDVESVIELTGQVDADALDWTAPEGDWILFSFWAHGTGQTASPSATVNYTVNYLDRAGVDAVIEYWTDVVLTPELKAEIAKNPRAQMYMDSLELSTFGDAGLFWGNSVADEFRARRGYAIEPWLPFLARTVPFMAADTTYHHEALEEQRITVDKVRFDYVRTLTDLYIENMLRPFAEFLHANGMTLRSEISYGLPFELTRPGPEVDGIETESLEFAGQLDAYRLLAGPAHLFRKQYSSETGATTQNHMLDHRFYDQIIATQLAAGITKTVMHGWASPAGAEGTTWPGHEGMWPMFSERFDTRQPASEFYPFWSDALARFQCVLRQGRPRIDVGILRTDHFVDNMITFDMLDDAGRRIPDEDLYANRWMRNRENPWWQDLGMQDAGWTYEYLDASLLMHDDVEFADGLVQPNGPGYQAVIVYQSSLDPDAAAHLLEWARAGLRVLVVNGVREVKLLSKQQFTTHERAAVMTQGLDGRDEELRATMAELVALPSVRMIDDPSETVAALRALGVRGRAEFVADNEQVFTHLREDGDLLHVYAYHFQYAKGTPTTVELSLPGEGAAYRIDPWSGAVRPHPATRVVDGRTVISVELEPGERALFTLDCSAAPLAVPAAERSVVAELDEWHIAVESWDAGESRVITEDRSLGYVTREVRPTTAVTRLDAGVGGLRPWHAIAEVGPEVSGVGEYSTTFVLGSLGGDERVILELGSTCGGLGSVVVNGDEPRGFDTAVPRVDVTDAVREGENSIVVRVSSSLNNRLKARGYYDDIVDILAQIVSPEQATHATRVRDYGLLGPVRVVREVAAG